MEKLPLYLGRALVTLLAGSGLQQVFGGALFGRLVFAGAASSLGYHFQESHLLRDSAPAWAAAILPQAFSDVLSLQLGWLNVAALLLTVGAFLALIAHVLFKGQRDRRLATPPAAGASGLRVTTARFYCRFYFHLTLGFVVLFSTLLVLESGLGLRLVLFFLILELPIVLYLFLYYSDMRSSRLVCQFTCIVMLLVFAFGLLWMPFHFGRRFFDNRLPVVVEAQALGEEAGPGVDVDGKLTVVFDEERDILGTIDFEGELLTIFLWRASGVRTENAYRWLRDLGSELEPAALQPGEVEEVVADSLADLRGRLR